MGVSGDCEQKGGSLVGCTLPGSPLTCQKAWKSPFTHLYLSSTSFSPFTLSASHGTSVRKPPGVIMLIEKHFFSKQPVESQFPNQVWNLGVFSGRCTGESLPLRVDFIHRVEFGEMSGHRVLTKRGPGNRPTLKPKRFLLKRARVLESNRFEFNSDSNTSSLFF